MYIILGGTGHVGSAAARALLRQGERVTIITRDASKGEAWQREGASIAVADARDTDALRRVFRTGKRAFLINPPADPATDTDVEERRTVSSIVAALDGSGLEKIVAESTYGAQRIERSGDLGVLYELERALDAQPIPVSIIRAAYYMSNWDASLESARNVGVVRSMLPADFHLPMVAPQDLGEFAARLLTEPVDQVGRHHMEGPQRYSPADVAAAFARALNKQVRVDPVPRERWQEAFESLGFSTAAAASYARMTAVTVDEKYTPPDTPERGSVSLQAYTTELVRLRAPN
jgi:uncharacterized protein YbjT (DUF2867 family)